MTRIHLHLRARSNQGIGTCNELWLDHDRTTHLAGLLRYVLRII